MFLIIDSNNANSIPFRRKFYNAGSFAMFATPKNYAAILSRYDFWAIIFPNPENIPCINEFTIKIADKYKKPVIFLNNNDSRKVMFNYLLYNGYVAKIIKTPILPRKMIDEVLDIAAENGCGYAYAKTAACVRYNRAFPRNTVKIFSQEIKLDHTEYSILHYLVHKYPELTPADEILNVAFRPGTKAAHNNVATQISKINAKLMPLCGYRLISCTYKKGYVLKSKNDIQLTDFSDFRTHKNNIGAVSTDMQP